MNQGAAWSSAETQKAEELGGERTQEERNEDESPVPGSLSSSLSNRANLTILNFR